MQFTNDKKSILILVLAGIYVLEPKIKILNASKALSAQSLMFLGQWISSFNIPKIKS
jgi:hypothetical protein